MTPRSAVEHGRRPDNLACSASTKADATSKIGVPSSDTISAVRRASATFHEVACTLTGSDVSSGHDGSCAGLLDAIVLAYYKGLGVIGDRVDCEEGWD
jgi:hypothetical protein